MAKFLGFHGMLSGSVAGQTYSHNKGGRYVRARSTPTNGNTVAQQAVRIALAYWARQWSAATEAVRQAWSDFAAANPVTDSFGAQITLSGESMFVGRQSRIQHAAFAALASAPENVTPYAADVTGSLVTFSNVTTAVVSVAGGARAATEKIQLLLSPGGGAGRDPNFKTAVHQGYSAVSLSGNFTCALPKAVVSGQTYNTWVRSVGEDGSVSPAEKCRVVVP